MTYPIPNETSIMNKFRNRNLTVYQPRPTNLPRMIHPTNGTMNNARYKTARPVILSTSSIITSPTYTGSTRKHSNQNFFA
jgi:hypothetical protein